MKIHSMYSTKIKDHSSAFRDTAGLFCAAVDHIIPICIAEWSDIEASGSSKQRMAFVESLIHATKERPVVKYPDFDKLFYKFPSYLRRSAVNTAIGKTASYMSNLENWKTLPVKERGRKPSVPKAGYAFPCMYRDGMFLPGENAYTVRLKVFIRNTWDWITVRLRKSDVDYVLHHCAGREQSAPTLTKRYKHWYLDFTYTEEVKLHDIGDCKETTIAAVDLGVNNAKVNSGYGGLFAVTDIVELYFLGDCKETTIAAVDLGVNNAATVSIMRSDGTIQARRFLHLGREKDSLDHVLNYIKKAQQHGAHKTPRLWNYAKGINDDLSVKTAQFIVDIAVQYNADVIVMEHLDLQGQKRGSGKQRLHHWKAQYVQQMVTDKAHRLGMHFSTVNAWNTSRLAFDGSGAVLRGRESKKTKGNYSLCEFPTGKVYNCDLNASYNIGARYFIREMLKSLSERAKSALEAKIPSVRVRSTCTLSTLISLNAVLSAGAGGH